MPRKRFLPAGKGLLGLLAGILSLLEATGQNRTDQLDSLGWSGSVAVTMLVQSGNLTSSAAAVFADVTYTWRAVGLTSLTNLLHSNGRGKAAVEREYLESVGLRFFPKHRFYPAVLGTVEKSRLRALSFRWSAGLGLSYNLVKARQAQLKLSALLLHETTRYDANALPPAEPGREARTKNALAGQFRLRGQNSLVRGHIKVSYNAFVQASLEDIKDYRLAVYLNLDVPITRHFSVRSIIRRTYERVVVPGTSPTNYLFTGGISLQL